MSFTVAKTSTIPCLQDLTDAINADVAIVTVCEFIRLDAPSSMTLTFTGTGPLSGPEDAALDALLGSFTCPPVVGPGVSQGLINAAAFDFPDNSDWIVNVAASQGTDAIEPGITVREFDDATEEGVGWLFALPDNVDQVTFKFKSRRRSNGSSGDTVPLNLYTRDFPNNTTPTAWSAASSLVTLAMTNTLASDGYQYDQITVPIGSLGLTAGILTQFELTRAQGTLAGDWYLTQIELIFEKG